MPTFVNINPFVELSNSVPTIALQGFLIAMAALTIGGVLLDIKRMLNIFLTMQKKQKKKQKQMFLQGRKPKLLLKQ